MCNFTLFLRVTLVHACMPVCKLSYNLNTLKNLSNRGAALCMHCIPTTRAMHLVLWTRTAGPDGDSIIRCWSTHMTHRTASHRLVNLLATARNGEKRRGEEEDSIGEQSTGIVLSVCLHSVHRSHFTIHKPFTAAARHTHATADPTQQRPRHTRDSYADSGVRTTHGSWCVEPLHPAPDDPTCISFWLHLLQ